uniref:H15 domain-containing protein n=1 Tax=Parascaris univalens TaxID=6257 RepID=A0A914ZLI7_PARUN
MAGVEVQQGQTTGGTAPTLASSPAAGDVAAAPVTKGTGKRGRPKSSKAKMSPTHPGYQQMIKAAILAINDKKGSSRAAILKHIAQNFKLGEQLPTINAHLRQALRRGVESGFLKHTKGTGASGSFLLAEPKARKEQEKVKKQVEKKSSSSEKNRSEKEVKKVENKKRHVHTKKSAGKAAGVKKTSKKSKVVKKMAKSPKISKTTKARKPKKMAVPKPKTA